MSDYLESRSKLMREQIEKLLEFGDGFYSRLDEKSPSAITSFDLWARTAWPMVREALAALRSEQGGMVMVQRERLSILEDVLVLARQALRLSISDNKDAFGASLGRLNLACKAEWDLRAKQLAAAQKERSTISEHDKPAPDKRCAYCAKDDPASPVIGETDFGPTCTHHFLLAMAAGFKPRRYPAPAPDALLTRAREAVLAVQKHICSHDHIINELADRIEVDARRIAEYMKRQGELYRLLDIERDRVEKAEARIAELKDELAVERHQRAEDDAQYGASVKETASEIEQLRKTLNASDSALARQTAKGVEYVGKLDAVATALGLPVECHHIADCDVLAHYVRDTIKNSKRFLDRAEKAERERDEYRKDAERYRRARKERMLDLGDEISLDAAIDAAKEGRG